LPAWASATRRFHEFLDVVSAARAPEEIQAALVRTAGELSGACRVELTVDRDDTSGAEDSRRQVALWPDAARAMSAAEVEALGYPLALGLWCGDHYQMTLELYARSGSAKRWPTRLVRRLTTLCTVAAAALRGMHAGRRSRRDDHADAPAPVRDATFLNAILPYALSQARRHEEPVTVCCIGIDGLAAVSQSHGAGAVDRAVRRVAEAVAQSLRASDVVARLDDDRIMVVLHNTGPANAAKVAGFVCAAVRLACLPVGGLPGLTAAVGIACFPADATDMPSLLSAADDAMVQASAQRGAE
jgi:diguanylate cyclase (GGDEF)-like protein